MCTRGSREQPLYTRQKTPCLHELSFKESPDMKAMEHVYRIWYGGFRALDVRLLTAVKSGNETCLAQC